MGTMRVVVLCVGGRAMVKHRRPELGRVDVIWFCARRQRGGVSFGYELEASLLGALERLGDRRVGELCEALVLELVAVFGDLGVFEGVAAADPAEAERGGAAPPGG